MSPKRWAGLNEISPAVAKRMHALYGMVLLRISETLAAVNAETKSSPQRTGRILAELVDSAAEAEHVVDSLLQLGQDDVAKQGIEREQQERAEDDRDQDLDGGVDVALAGVARKGAAGETEAADGEALNLGTDGVRGVDSGGLDGIEQLFHKMITSKNIVVL